MTDRRDTTDGSTGRSVGAVLGMLGLVAAVTVGALAVSSSQPAAAAALEQFTSCAELEAWTDDVVDQAEQLAVPAMGGADGGEGGAAILDAATPAPAAGRADEETASFDETSSGSAGVGTSGAAASAGGTNTVVEGVDEIDVIDRVGPDRLLVSRGGVLALVDLAGRTVVAQLAGMPSDARISVANGLVWAAGSSNDGLGTEVRRIRIDGDTLTEDGSFRTPGYLLDARRTGDRLHLVAVDHPQLGAIPFEDGPVPCDEVWRPVAPATTPSATLVATLPPTGELVPTAAAEITGAAGTLLVTDTSLYVATESYAEAAGATGVVPTVTTGLHRFDLDSLTPTGSGSVPGHVAGPFALSEHEGNLRVATSLDSFGGRGFPMPMPMPVEGDGTATIDNAGGQVAPAVEAPPETAAAAPVTAQAPPTTVGDDGSTTTVVDETTTTEAPPTTAATTTTEAPTTTVAETTTAPPTTAPEPDAPEDALAEVFVLDTEGDLDLLGRTGRFGHEFETIHGVRFVGDVAYVVTFLQTDPFWVVDLADPAAPAVAGELQIPGFSGYLHPLGDGRVVGFGPDGAGGVAARLFDVADPSAPSVLDEIRLGDDSPVAYDHHAFVGLDGGRFAVPVMDYP
ncbi:MAG: beta-propeller domain-containing protein, partial [Acidimicrobiia bacterium]|nr:beta-propeller domain-containing protein [Acidimicrobiia bacterium]